MNMKNTDALHIFPFQYDWNAFSNVRYLIAESMNQSRCQNVQLYCQNEQDIFVEDLFLVD